MPSKAETERGKLRVSESRGKVYFYYAEREQVQAHEVRLNLKIRNKKTEIPIHPPRPTGTPP